MTLQELRNSLRSDEPPEHLSFALLACGGMPKATGREHTSRLSRTKAPRVRGSMRTCIAKKVTTQTRSTGIVAPARHHPEHRLSASGQK